VIVDQVGGKDVLLGAESDRDFGLTDRTGDFACTCLIPSTRFSTGRHVIDDLSVCYRSAWEASHHDVPLVTYTPQNPQQLTLDWPFRGMDHVFIRCDDSGPTLLVRNCVRVFDQGIIAPSGHYGIAVDLETSTPSQ
jgi:hypothetical protein